MGNQSSYKEDNKHETLCVDVDVDLNLRSVHLVCVCALTAYQSTLCFWCNLFPALGHLYGRFHAPIDSNLICFRAIQFAQIQHSARNGIEMAG